MSARQQGGTALKAVLFLMLAILCFDAMSVLVRLLLPRYSVQELSAYRNVVGVLPSLVLMIYTRELRLRGTVLRITRWRLALLRGGIVAMAQFLLYSGIGYLELATVSALGQTNALFVVLLSVLLLGERVGPWRIFALFLGFAGAIWIIQPGSDAFSLYALYPVGATLCYAVSMVTVRMFGPEVSNGLLYLYSSVAAAAGAFLFAALTTQFTPMASWADMGLILTMSLVGGTGVLFIMLAYRMGPPSLLAPFGYFGILTAFGVGWLFFGEAPIDTLFPGVFLIVGAGAVIMWRENRRAGAKA